MTDQSYSSLEFKVWSALKDQWEEDGTSIMSVAGIATDCVLTELEQVKLQPLERTTLSIVHRMIQEDRDVPPNMTTMLVMTIERMQGELEQLTERDG